MAPIERIARLVRAKRFASINSFGSLSLLTGVKEIERKQIVDGFTFLLSGRKIYSDFTWSTFVCHVFIDALHILNTWAYVWRCADMLLQNASFISFLKWKCPSKYVWEFRIFLNRIFTLLKNSFGYTSSNTIDERISVCESFRKYVNRYS